MGTGALALKKHGMPALGWWLMAVGVVRFALTTSCFFSSASLCSSAFSEIQMSRVHGRTFAVWTLLSCTLCFLCAFNLGGGGGGDGGSGSGSGSRPLYVATFMSFVYALVYLSAECVVYHTIGAANLVPFVFIAGTSIVWMLLQWNSQLGHGPRGATATSNSKQA